MKNFKYYTLSTALVLLLNGCGGSSSDIKIKEGADEQLSKTLSIGVLGITQEWQKNPVQKSWIEAKEYCQSLSLEGSSDWRLPTSKEFFALLDTNQSIDAHFPKTSTIKEFWSSDETSFDIDKAWKITAWSSSEAYTDKKKVLGVRCVRGEMLSTHSFTKESNSLKDINPSGKELRWQDNNDSSKILVNFDEAKRYCEAKSQRLPTIFELQNMVNKQNLSSPFTNLNSSDFTAYWSATAQPTNQTQSLTLNFMTGGVNFSDNSAKNFVRCLENINHLPTVVAIQSVLVDEDSQVTIVLEGSDSDNDTLTKTITKMPDHGTFVNNIYTPQANYHGVDTIKYIVSDGFLESVEATITITINNIDDIPVANNISTSTVEDSSKDIILAVTDIDSDTFTYTIVSSPQHGTLSGVAPSLTYTPNQNYNGLDSFTYKVNDGSSDSNTATVTISIGSQNDAPTANPLTLSTNEDVELSVTLQGSDPEGSTLNYEIISNPTHGVVTGSGSSRIYIPNSNYYGLDSFTYRVNDGELDSSIVTVNITVSSVNDIPTATSKTVTTDEDMALLINLEASDDDNDTLIFHVSNPLHGVLSGTAPNLTYIPEANYNGTDTFTFYVSDAESNSLQATIDINISSVNDTPIADAGNDIVTDADSLITLNGSNSSDIDGNIVSYLWREGVTILSTSSTFSQPFSVGIHAITLQVTDNDGLISTDAVTVTINSGTAPSFTSHTVTTNASKSEWLEMVDLDKDGDLDILSASKGNGGAEIAWYENRGDYTFTEHTITANANAPESIKAADMDSDGDLDILYTTYASGTSLMQCINDGSQNFSCSAITNATDGLSYIDIVDMDKDGKKDIISASWSNNMLQWLKNSGDGTFTGAHLVDDADANQVISIDTADFNQDGKVDIVAAHHGSNRIDWYAYNTAGNGDFVHHLVANVAGVYSVNVADINHDGYDDIISTSNSDGKVYWHKSTQSTDPTFSTVLIANLTNVYYACGVDMDNDGDIDILSASSEIGGKIAWYENIGLDSNFPEHIVASGVNNVIRVFAADIDNDGNMDVISGDDVGNVVFYENSTTDTSMLLPKTGDISDGGAGADANFTRESATGIVTDNVTGLMWSDDGTATDSVAYWSTVDSTCKGMEIGGHTDWRIPTLHELYYLLDRSQFGAKIDTTFSNIATNDGYWAYENVSMTYSWVDFNTAESHTVSIVSLPKKHIRCVRGNISEAAFIRDDTKQVVLDYKHKLMWDDSATRAASWSSAESTCSTLVKAGYSDWRLPNINELYSIGTISGVTLSMHQTFNYRQDGSYWSATQQDSSTVYTLSFGSSLEDTLVATSSGTHQVKCVRDIP